MQNISQSTTLTPAIHDKLLAEQRLTGIKLPRLLAIAVEAFLARGGYGTVIKERDAESQANAVKSP